MAAGASLGPTLALTVTLAVACFAVVLASTVLVIDPGPQAFPLGVARAQGLESALYVAVFAAILPLALLVAPRVADAIATGPNAAGLPALSAFLAGTLAASILVARLLPGGGVEGLLIVMGVWWVGGIALLARARRPTPWSPLLRAAQIAPAAWGLAGVLALGALLAFTSLSSVNPVVVALGAVAAAAGLVAYARWKAARLPRPWGLAIDVAVIVVVLLMVPDLVIFRPEDVAVNPSAALDARWIQFHHDLWLGPANQVLAGDAVLVDTASQYGVAPIYLLAGWFQLAPIGYGTLGFFDSALSALFFAAGYCLLRIAGAPRPLAALGLAVGIIALAYNHPWSIGVFPQQGPLRFGLPMAIIFAAALEARWPRWARRAQGAQLVVLGMASIWSVDSFASSAATFAGIVCFQAWTRPGQGRFRWLARRVAVALVACGAAHFVFAAATLAATGQALDWGQYLAFVDVFLFGGLSKLTFDVPPWSAGLAVGAAYLASAVAIVLVVWRRRDIVDRERTALVVLSGTTAYGIALFSYFVDRSLDSVLPYIAFPALAIGVTWLSLLMRRGEFVLRLGGLASALTLSVLLVAVAWSSVGERLPRSALAYALPGGDSVGKALHRLWHLPPINPRTQQGEELLHRYMPGKRRVLILVNPDLQTEILMRAGRANELPFSYPWEDDFVGTRRLPVLREAVAGLRPGERLLTEAIGLKELQGSVTEPLANPIDSPLELDLGRALVPLQISALRLIDERFKLRVIHRDEQGFVVVTLAPRP